MHPPVFMCNYFAARSKVRIGSLFLETVVFPFADMPNTACFYTPIHAHGRGRQIAHVNMKSNCNSPCMATG
jgi:hypothetical protein